MTTATTAYSQRRPENLPLTAIRGLASLWIVAHHWLIATLAITPPVLRLGYTAVDVFFILSGLILTDVYWPMRLAGTGWFLLRRVCRIYPVQLAVFLALCVIATYPAWSWQTAESVVQWQLLASALTLQPFLSLSTICNPPSWSVGVELCCYLVFPFALLATRAARSRFLQLSLLVAAAVLECLIAHVCLGRPDGWPALARGFGGFGLGMIMCNTLHGRNLGMATVTAGEVLGIAGIAVAIILNWAEPIPLSAALLLAALYYDSGPLALLLRNPVLVWLGRVSFSLYLLHFPLLLAGDKWMPPGMFPGRPLAATLLRLGVLFILLLLLSAASYRYVEAPGRRIPGMLIRWFGRPTPRSVVA